LARLAMMHVLYPPRQPPGARKRDDDNDDDNDHHHHHDDEEKEDVVDFHGAPIANLFAQTTIFFADIAGFTQWSSTRMPTEVFALLETLYGAFDKLARKHLVFKVETIGDYYVAATGIPKPQVQHAVIMVQFARECMQKMDILLHTKLTAQLGADTRQLQMHVGLHSGPTTAGVLRGDRGWFQLFGDTVNTALRMESMGVPGQIHISQATAEQLIVQGKSDWLVSREQPVMVKGKGEMQTYFVAVAEASVALSVAPCSTYEHLHCSDATATLSTDIENESNDDIKPKVLALSDSLLEDSIKTIKALLAKRNKQNRLGKQMHHNGDDAL